MTTFRTDHVYARCLQRLGRRATEYATSLLGEITRPDRSFLFHDAEDGQNIVLARHWLTFAAACAQVVADLADQGSDALDDATVSLIADPRIREITAGTDTQRSQGWSIRYPADPDVLGIDIAALVAADR
jgi:hypothetical protein